MYHFDLSLMAQFECKRTLQRFGNLADGEGFDPRRCLSARSYTGFSEVNQDNSILLGFYFCPILECFSLTVSLTVAFP
jgi:hypothetical protein